MPDPVQTGLVPCLPNELWFLILDDFIKIGSIKDILILADVNTVFRYKIGVFLLQHDSTIAAAWDKFQDSLKCTYLRCMFQVLEPDPGRAPTHLQIFIVQVRALIKEGNHRGAQEKLIEVMASGSLSTKLLFSSASTKLVVNGKPRRVIGLEDMLNWQMAWASEYIEQTPHILLAVHAIRHLRDAQRQNSPEYERELELELQRHLSKCVNRISDARFGLDLVKEAVRSGNTQIMHTVVSHFDPPSLTDLSLLLWDGESEWIQKKPMTFDYRNLTSSYVMVATAIRIGDMQAISAWIDHAAVHGHEQMAIALRNIARVAVHVDSVFTLQWLMEKYSLTLNLDRVRANHDKTQKHPDQGQLLLRHLFQEAYNANAFEVAKWLYSTWVDYFSEYQDKVFLHECFMSAISACSRGTLTWILNQFPSFDPNSNWPRPDGSSNPIIHALRGPHWDETTVELVKLLLEGGVRPNKVCDDDDKVVLGAITSAISNKPLITPLRLALDRKRMDVVSLLLDHGADFQPNSSTPQSKAETCRPLSTPP